MDMYLIGIHVCVAVLMGFCLLMALEAGLRWYRTRDTRRDIVEVIPPVGQELRRLQASARKAAGRRESARVRGARLLSLGRAGAAEVLAFWREGWGVIAHGPHRGRGGGGVR